MTQKYIVNYTMRNKKIIFGIEHYKSHITGNTQVIHIHIMHILVHTKYLCAVIFQMYLYEIFSHKQKNICIKNSLQLISGGH